MATVCLRSNKEGGDAGKAQANSTVGAQGFCLGEKPVKDVWRCESKWRVKT